MSQDEASIRARALQRFANGEISRAEYDHIILRIDELYALPPRLREPEYVPTYGDREKGTVAGIPIPPALKPGTLLDKYELKSSKRGGMGEVWKAWDAKADRWVALKLLPQELRGNSGEIARIRSQFKLVEQLDHPHICRLFDLNEHPVWGWYEVMRWIDGETLAEIAANAGGKLPYERVVRLLWPVSRALDHAHARNVLHRDIKPLNIMEDGEGKVHVIDFGLAAEVRGSLSRVSRKFDGLSGTPQYLAPELWNEAPESPRSDQYALGVTAYELLAGRPPFKTDNLAILMARIQTAEVQSIGGLHGDAMAVILRSLAKQPDDRFGSCTEFLKTLANPPRVTPFQPSPVPHDGQEATQIPELPAASQTPSEQNRSNQSEQPFFLEEVPSALTRSLETMPAVVSPQISPTAPEVSESPAAPINPLQIPFDQRGSWPAMLKSPVNKAKAPRWLRDWATGLDSLRGLRPRLSDHWMRAIFTFLALSVAISIGVIWFDGSRSGQPTKAVADTSPPSPKQAKASSSSEPLTTLPAVPPSPEQTKASSSSKPLTTLPAVPPSPDQMETSKGREPLTASSTVPPPLPTTSSGAQPAPLRSPFSQSDAEVGQKAWAAHLGRQVYEKNSLGMEFALIPPGSFEMGSPKSEPRREGDEGPVSVTLTRPFWLERTEVTRKEWKAVMGTEPWGSQPGDEYHPATFVGWEDGAEYCRQLTEREGGDWEYRLPTEAEWEWACRGGTLTAYWFGDGLDGSQANCDGTFPYRMNKKGPYKQGTTEVGRYDANPFGLWDMHGNVWEWCTDWYHETLRGGENPEVFFGSSIRVIRGGSWRDPAVDCRSASWYGGGSGPQTGSLGLRVLSVPSLSKSLAAPPRLPTTSSGPKSASLRSPFIQTEAEAGQKAWAAYLGRQVYEKNSLGMEFAVIPPGSFQMGSPKSEKERVDNEGPVPVTLTRPYWLGRTEVTRGQWKAVMGGEPWRSQSGTEDHPATSISWEDGLEFCRRLTERDDGVWTYRLPTEAEWEWACRGGTLTAYWFGNELNGSQANCNGHNPYGTSRKGPYKQGTTAVGSYGANRFGLWDMHGNVWEWCADWYQEALPGGENPEVTSGGSYRVIRGGSWSNGAVFCRSAARDWLVPGFRGFSLGFRVLAVPSPR